MLAGGVKIFEYEQTMIHEKTLVVDGMFSMFGSSNLDARSSEINEELDITVYDRGFGRQMESVFENDLRQSREYTFAEFKERSLWERTTRMADASLSFAAVAPNPMPRISNIETRSYLLDRSTTSLGAALPMT